MKSGVTRTRLCSYFDKYRDKAITIHDIYSHFTDVSAANLNYHLKHLVDDTFLLRQKRGLYKKNPDFRTIEEKRAILDSHIEHNGSRVRPGPGWKPGEEPIKEATNPALAAYLGRCFGDSILERMKTTGFTSTEQRFVERLLVSLYPLSEQQRNSLERLPGGDVRPTAPR